MAKLYVVGIGPGGKEHMTFKAVDVLNRVEVVVGYQFYIEMIRSFIEGKRIIQNGMMGEVERCKEAIACVKNGLDTAIVSTGDAGLYGMAGLILEMAEGIDVEIVPGVSAVFSAAAECGAPLMHDFCTISMSDLLTPWECIEKRIIAAAEADFVVAIYNPRSKGRPDHLETAIALLKRKRSPETPVAVVRNAGRTGNEKILTNLKDIPYDRVDMMSIVIVGNSQTYIKGNWMVTPRGYKLA